MSRRSDIYAQHDTAFAAVSAYVILKSGERFATVALKRGESRVQAFVHCLGTEMVRGFADGGGYDKASAATARAARKHNDNLAAIHPNCDTRNFWNALENDNGTDWTRRLEEVGFRVLQAI